MGVQFCEAVGSFGPQSGAEQTLVENWNGSSWTLVPSPNTSASDDNGLGSVDCFSQTACSAVGFAGNDNLAQVWNGTDWTIVNPPSAPGSTSSLNTVTCLTDWSCVTVGTYGSATAQQAFAATASIARSGYRFVASDGGVFSFGGTAAPFLGSMGGIQINAPVVGMAVTSAGDGYYLVGADGGVYTFGSAQFYGSTGSLHLNAPIVGMAVTADGAGLLAGRL